MLQTRDVATATKKEFSRILSNYKYIGVTTMKTGEPMGKTFNMKVSSACFDMIKTLQKKHSVNMSSFLRGCIELKYRDMERVHDNTKSD